MRARRVPDGRLSGLLLDRELLGYQHSRAQFASWLEPARPQLTLMIDLDGGLTANGERLPDVRYRDAGPVMVGQYLGDGWLGGEAPRPLSSTVSIYVVVDDPDRHRAVAAQAGANMVRELEDMDYGSREYSVRDPEGNLWSFGTYDPYGVSG